MVALARTTTSPDSGTDSSSASTLNNASQQDQGEEEGRGPRGGADAEAARAGIPPNSVVDAAVVVYINRLSDYLFTAARFLVRVACMCSAFEQSRRISEGVERGRGDSE